MLLNTVKLLPTCIYMHSYTEVIPSSIIGGQGVALPLRHMRNINEEQKSKVYERNSAFCLECMI